MLGIENDWNPPAVVSGENGDLRGSASVRPFTLSARAEIESTVFQIENRDDATIVHVLGNVDFFAKAAFRETLELVERHASGAVIVDLRDCPYVDSEGLGELIRLHRMWGKRLGIVAPVHGVVARVFSISGLDLVFNVQASVSDALSRAAV